MLKIPLFIAQKIYENGKTTYMITDVYIAPEFSKKVEIKINSYGPEYYSLPKVKKVKGH